MRYLYIVCTTGGRSDVEGNFFDMARNMLSSASLHNPDVTLLCNWVDLTNDVRDMVLTAWGPNVQFYNIPSERWGGKFAFHKIDVMRFMPYREGDEIVMLDVDTMVQGSLFDVFDFEFDMAITTRPEPGLNAPQHSRIAKSELPVNLGYTAYRWSPSVSKFIDAWSLQICSPTWKPYRHMLERFHRVDSSMLCGDQDLMCTIITTQQNPFADIDIKDVGPKYNWFPDFDGLDELDKAWEQIEPKLGDSNYRVIHLKGHLKPLAPKILAAMKEK